MSPRPTRRRLPRGLTGLVLLAAALACAWGPDAPPPEAPEAPRRDRNARERVRDAAELHTTTFRGETREYRLLLPRDRSEPIPLVVALHGGGGHEESLMLPHKRIPETAKARGWAVVFPSGNRGEVGKWQVDDDELLVQIVDEVAAMAPIDPDRVYLVGFSGGGRLAYQTAAEHPDRFAAIAAISGRAGVRRPDGEFVAPYDPNAHGATGVPVFGLFGGEDPIRLGADPDRFRACMAEAGATEAACAERSRDGLSFEESLALWDRANRTSEAVQQVTIAQAPSTVRARRRTNPATGVAVQGAIDPDLGHTWPSWNLAETIFDFFDEMHRHPRR